MTPNDHPREVNSCCAAFGNLRAAGLPDLSLLWIAVDSDIQVDLPPPTYCPTNSRLLQNEHQKIPKGSGDLWTSPKFPAVQSFH